MPNRNSSGENNRANEGNQSSRHQHTKGAGSTYPSPEEQQAGQQSSEAHEYYPEFDQTGRGVNPKKRIKKH
jgi:hypothetical protein